MPYELSWLLDKRVIHLRAFDILTAQEYETSADELLSMFDDGIAPVHVVVDHLDVDEIKLSPTLVKDLIFPNQHEASGWTILVAASKLATFSISMITQLNNVSIRTCDTLEEAMETLQRVDNSISAIR